MKFYGSLNSTVGCHMTGPQRFFFFTLFKIPLKFVPKVLDKKVIIGLSSSNPLPGPMMTTDLWHYEAIIGCSELM